MAVPASSVRPVRGAEVVLALDDGRVLARGVTDEDGLWWVPLRDDGVFVLSLGEQCSSGPTGRTDQVIDVVGPGLLDGMLTDGGKANGDDLSLMFVGPSFGPSDPGAPALWSDGDGAAIGADQEGVDDGAAGRCTIDAAGHTRVSFAVHVNESRASTLQVVLDSGRHG